jgi:hypothetical protein
MKKILFTLSLLIAVATTTAQKTAEVWWLRGFTYFQKFDENDRVIAERETDASISWNDKQMIFIRGGDDRKSVFQIVSVQSKTFEGLTSKFFKTTADEGRSTVWIQVFDDQECGVIFRIIGAGTYGYYPHKPK